MKPTLYMMRGLPGAGKSTEARRICVETGAVRVNKDDMRAMLFGEDYRAELEPIIHRHLCLLVEDLLFQGFSVVVDNTNLRARDETRWLATAETMGAVFQVIDIDTPVVTCIANDAGRERPVGEEVIMDFARRYGRV